ncbi:restriction endonuclease S subunit [[Clostridium] sordellii]|uniref:restriction endonuclease subunit S n=1 Tax=Paraclostridium sordellii TaxID=1505 RepID=UPI0005DD7253|nr:restriction endonuclease subunit S [Paeniclostridium sordellii]CEO35449.1 restriction endonuclease S subunit [[Clostridium] sordellii] [Paeniclostridium sordellii]CEP92793.1 restriction endonuclease S subunit [[Clostridium] sordellii] [Paeniclostridium sordellii]
MKKYDSYKDSGVEWIGEIPSHWNSSVFRRYCTLQQGLQIAQEKRFDSYEEGRYKYLTVKYINKPLAENLEYIKSPSVRVICKEDDVLLARTGATGEVVTGYEGVFHNNFFKINFDKQCIEKDYLVYYLKQNKVKDYLKLIAGTTTIPDLNHGDFLSTIFLVPSKREQEYIVKYLDKKTSEIDNLISSKEELIETLKKYRQSLITEVVTKGIDPNVKMKDSGVEWIGGIPEHWNTTKIKYTTYVKGRIGWQGLKSDEFIDEGPYLVTGTDFEKGKVNWSSCYHISEERYNEAIPIQLRDDDLLITKDGSIGKLAMVVDKPYKAILNSGIFVTRTLNNEYISKFLYYILMSDVFKRFISYYETGSTIKHLYQETFINFEYALTSLEEQKEIVNYLDSKIEGIDNLLDTINTQIQTLKDYRQSLIFEAVTGKIDVR